MKYLLASRIALVSLQLGACASAPVTVADKAGEPAIRRSNASSFVEIRDEGGAVVVERQAHRAGESSVSVEKLARGNGCTSSRGAGLMTERGPVEVYRMYCEDGRVFMARCEFRQCRPMR